MNTPFLKDLNALLEKHGINTKRKPAQPVGGYRSSDFTKTCDRIKKTNEKYRSVK